MNKRMMRHTDLEPMLWPGLNDSPFRLMFRLGCLASWLIGIISWLVLIAAMVAQLIEWAVWPFIALPITAWLVFLAVPAFLSARRGSLAILDAITMTAEAWLARAGYSIDLNNDGLIGHEKPQIEPVKTNVVTPAVWHNENGTRLLANETPALSEGKSAPPVTRTLWQLPNGHRCPVETVCQFVDGVFVRGSSRETWTPKRLDRETYDGLIMLLETGNILEGRKPGFTGRLTVGNATEARRTLGLPGPGHS